MKILSFSGGLGNQIFEYAFFSYLRRLYPNHKIYGYYPHRLLLGHNGLEINKWFDVDLPKSTQLSCLVYESFRFLNKMFIRAFYDNNSMNTVKPHAYAIDAFKYTKEYFGDVNWLRFKIKESMLSLENQCVLNQINTSNSYFIHIRRGDYLNPKIKSLYGNICTDKYYRDAINLISTKTDNVVFFVFSDDLVWVKDKFKNDNFIFVDINHGIDSPIDMYLMSCCKGGIMANSTFSYFGAYLGKQDIVIYPKKWINDNSLVPNIFYDNWIGL